MSHFLPSLKPKQVVRALKKAGFVEDHQEGSHLTLLRASDKRRVVVPIHNRDLGTGLLNKIVADAGLTKQEFKELL